MQLSDLKKAMKGVCVIQVTPFNKDESLDLEGMRANTRWLVKRTEGRYFVYTPLGSGGQFYTLSDDETIEVIKIVVEEVNGKHPVVVGTGRAGTRETIRITKIAQSLGADGAQVVLPYYHVPYEEALYQHYEQLAKSVDPNFGIMLYNNARVSGCWMKPHVMQRLSKIPNIIAVKENTQHMVDFYEMWRALDPKDLSIMIGTGEQMYSFAAVYGVAGYISGIANFDPDLAYSVYEAGEARDFSKLTEIVNSLYPWFEFLRKVTTSQGPSAGISGPAVMYTSVRREATNIVGLKGGYSRMPVYNLTDAEKAELREVLKAIKVIS